MSPFVIRSDLKPVVNTLRLLALCKVAVLGFVFAPIMPFFQSFSHGSGILIQSFVLSVFSIAMIEAAAQGLLRRKNWGLILTLIVCMLQLPTLLFPFSIALLWFLLPSAYRSEVTAFLKEELKSESSKVEG